MNSTHPTIQESLTLVRDFGILVNQVAFYGVAHKVIQDQIAIFFNSLKSLLQQHESLELVVLHDKIAVNGRTDGIDAQTSRNLKERMMLHKVHGLSFLPTIEQHELAALLSLLGTLPVRLADKGGFEAALKQANLANIHLVQYALTRVGKEHKEAPPPKTQVKATVTEGQDGKSAASALPSKQPIKAARFPQFKEHRKVVQSELLSLLSEVSQLVTTEGETQDVSQDQRMLNTLRSIRDTLRTTTETSKQRIATLLDHKKPKKPATPASPSLPARKERARYTQKELMGRYAELTQEIAQPLTVTNGVIELLKSGQAGPLTEAQTHFIDLAVDSVERVNQLIKYMHSLSGEPDTLIPDASIVHETYK